MSNFQVAAWIPKYLRWYRLAFGRRLTLEELRALTGEPATTTEQTAAETTEKTR